MRCLRSPPTPLPLLGVVACLTSCGASHPNTITNGDGAPGGNADGAPGGSADGAVNTGSPSDGATALDGADGSDGARNVVLPCPSLGSVTAPLWDNLSPSISAAANVDYRDFRIDPQNSATVYLGTANQGIYRTQDCGSTWVKINTGTNGDIIDNGIVWSMDIDRQNSQVIWANAGFSYGHNAANTHHVNGVVFKSTNGGVDWAEMLPAGYGDISKLTLDAGDGQHVLVSFHANCTGSPPACLSSVLAESKDSGATWNFVPAPTSWKEGDGQCMIDSKTWLFGAPFDGIWRTTDSGTNWAKVYAGYASANCFLLPGGAYYVASAQGVRASQDGGLTWTSIGAPSYGLSGDSTTLFASNNGPPYQMAAQASPVVNTKWTTLPSPSGITAPNGARLEYDADHRLLYSSNHTGGFWRARLP